MTVRTDALRSDRVAFARAGISSLLWAEVADLFAREGLPEGGEPACACDRIVMVSTHGYWGDPPPAGATDTGGQTLYVLTVSKEWARAGRKVLILARWFGRYRRVDRLEENLWLVRIPAGDASFVRKEDIYPLAPELAEYATAVAARFGARGVMGHYADGMVVAAEVAARLGLPLVAMPHSLALTKIGGLGFDPADPRTWFDERYHFGAREECELAALAQADCIVGCMPDQLEVLTRAYGLTGRRDFVAPGVAPVFLEAAARDPDPSVPAGFGLEPGRYLIVTSRLAETKNIPGAVALLGEVRALGRGDVSLALVGGNERATEPEEIAVEAGIAEAMARYRLTERDVRRIPAQSWPTVAELLRHALFYVGMQHFEPFGMGAAEALAVGTPVLLSRRAGIAGVLEELGTCARFVDPADPAAAAASLVEALARPEELRRMVETGRDVARQAFSWPQAAARLARRFDALLAMPGARARGHHRLAAAWRGDRPRIAARHVRAADQLLPHVIEGARMAMQSGRRLIVALGGESGAGKTEIAHCLRIRLRSRGIGCALVPGDAFFRLAPEANHQARVSADRAGRLADAIGPPREIDLEALDRVLVQAARASAAEVWCPSDCRRLPGRRYERVPLDLARSGAVIVDSTYAMLLDAPALRIFLDSSYREREEEIRRRNLARDPDQDLSTVMKVLAIEHELIRPTSARAHLLVDRDGQVREAAAGCALAAP